MNNIKDFIEYVLNVFKFWVIIQPWQAGLRIRNGNHSKFLDKGIHFRIPFFDSVYVQETRMRIVDMAAQTITSSDGQTITIIASLGYSVESIEKLYESLYHPELTIVNHACGTISKYIREHTAKECNQDEMEKIVIESLNNMDYGLRFEYCKITSFAIVRTVRLIRDASHNYEELDMNKKT